jgi:hypothetical protein
MHRKTDYKTEYDDMIIEHMEQGFSFESFAGVVGCCLQTLYNWAERNPSFLESKKIGFEKSRHFWEKVAIGQSNGSCNGNPTMAIFNLKNRFPKQWRDKQEFDMSNTDGTLKPTIDTSKLTIEQLKALKDAKINANKS